METIVQSVANATEAYSDLNSMNASPISELNALLYVNAFIGFNLTLNYFKHIKTFQDDIFTNDQIHGFSRPSIDSIDSCCWVSVSQHS